MIGLGTNVLVRYLTQDDPVQSPKAARLLEQTLTEDNPGFISIVAMTETVWVLERAYGFAAGEIAAVIERMLQATVLVVDHEQAVFSAAVSLKDNQASFADALIGALGAEAGCSATMTFDRRAARLAEFALV
jgi:predicted nucleic-acid-binding protein